MMRTTGLRGLFVSTVTPFDANGSINLNEFGRHVNWLVEQGVHGLLVGATAGEYASLSDQERYEIAAQAVTIAARRIPVIAYAGHMNRDCMLRLAQRLELAGVDAIMLAAPLVLGPTQEEIEAYFREVASTVGVGVVIYNQPGRTGTNIEVDTVARLSAVPNIVAMKESGRKIEKTAEIIDTTPDGFAVLAGEADLFLATLALGAAGGILTPSNFVPKLTLSLYAAFQRGDLPLARQINAKLLGLLHVLKGERKYHSAVKAAMRGLNMPVGLPRPPLADVSENLKERIKVYVTDMDLC